ncbi:hypothetical protein C8R46DRAFT_610032 [Mycena filopes]|nr:hypothetical protein C8R46DRAFT_610032 [Mycena filopes]
MDIDENFLPTPEVTTIALELEDSTYLEQLANIHASFARGSPQNGLKLSLSKRPGDTPQRVIADIIQPYASRLTSLDLYIDIDVVENLLRLPAGTFPQLQSLRLTVVHRVHTGWLLFRPEDDPTITNMLALAPRLSSFEFDHGGAPSVRNISQRRSANAAVPSIRCTLDSTSPT